MSFHASCLFHISPTLFLSLCYWKVLTSFCNVPYILYRNLIYYGVFYCLFNNKIIWFIKGNHTKNRDETVRMTWLKPFLHHIKSNRQTRAKEKEFHMCRYYSLIHNINGTLHHCYENEETLVKLTSNSHTPTAEHCRTSWKKKLINLSHIWNIICIFKHILSESEFVYSILMYRYIK